MSITRLQWAIAPIRFKSGKIQRVSASTMFVATPEGLLETPVIPGAQPGDRVVNTAAGWVKTPKKEQLPVYYV